MRLGSGYRTRRSTCSRTGTIHRGFLVSAAVVSVQPRSATATTATTRAARRFSCSSPQAAFVNGGLRRLSSIAVPRRPAAGTTLPRETGPGALQKRYLGGGREAPTYWQFPHRVRTCPLLRRRALYDYGGSPLRRPVASRWCEACGGHDHEGNISKFNQWFTPDALQ